MKQIKKFGSLKITLLLLLCLAAFSIVGTIIDQGQENRFYLDKYGMFLGKTILFIDADNFYNSFLYNLLLFFLVLNLSVCTVNSCNFKLLKDKRKLALFLLHFGVLIFFAGALISKFTKQAQYYTLFPGEKVVLEEGKAEIVFKEFNVYYYLNTQQPREYRSRVSLFEGGRFKEERIIRTNHPLHYKGFSFYQSGFEVFADLDIKIRHMGRIIFTGNWPHAKEFSIHNKNNLRFKMTHFLPDARVDENGAIRLHSYKLGKTAMLISTYAGDELINEQWVSNDETLNELFTSRMPFFEFEVKNIRPVYATVIQKIKDPGLHIVMIGFAVLFSGMILFLLHKRF